MSEARIRQLEDRVEPPYRSRGEAQVGRFFDRYRIPFFYEPALLIMDRGLYRIWYPDFTLPDHQHLVIEYAGMMELPDYAAGIRHKQEVYAANCIRALFVYPEDIIGSNWPGQLLRRIDEAMELQPRTPDIYSLYRCLRP